MQNELKSQPFLSSADLGAELLPLMEYTMHCGNRSCKSNMGAIRLCFPCSDITVLKPQQNRHHPPYLIIPLSINY